MPSRQVRALVKVNPFPFRTVKNGSTGKRNVTKPEKENYFFAKKGEDYKKIKDHQSFI